mmetsp:Transcript_55504/g.154618  ORF Transcript_55504/g.154618 Transcript_55504/m.154618 type:complete len:453 (+) Transcript_55504:61-1419(+)
MQPWSSAFSWRAPREVARLGPASALELLQDLGFKLLVHGLGRLVRDFLVFLRGLPLLCGVLVHGNLLLLLHLLPQLGQCVAALLEVLDAGLLPLEEPRHRVLLLAGRPHEVLRHAEHVERALRVAHGQQLLPDRVAVSGLSEDHGGDGDGGAGVGERGLVGLVAEVPDVDAAVVESQEDDRGAGRAPDASREVRGGVRGLEEVLLHAALPEEEGPVGDAQEDLGEERGPLQREHRPEGLGDGEDLLDELRLPVLLRARGPVAKDQLPLLRGGIELCEQLDALVVVPVATVEEVATPHLCAAVLALQLHPAVAAVYRLPQEVRVVDGVQDLLEVPDQNLAVAGDGDEVLHGAVLGVLLACAATPLLDLDSGREPLDSHDGLPVRLVDDGHLLVPHHRRGRAPLVLLRALTLLPHRVAEVGVGELPHRHLPAAEPRDQKLLVAGVELEHRDLPG